MHQQANYIRGKKMSSAPTVYDPVSGGYISGDATYSGDDTSAGDLSGGSDGGDSLLTQLSGLFSNIGTTVSSTVRGVSGPATVRPGTIVLDSSGRPVNTGFNLPTGNTGMFIMVGLAIIVLVLLLRR
jgi:hypothetical protein